MSSIAYIKAFVSFKLNNDWRRIPPIRCVAYLFNDRKKVFYIVLINQIFWSAFFDMMQSFNVE